MKLSGVIFPTSWIFLGNHDDNNRSSDTARYAGGGTKSVRIIIQHSALLPPRPGTLGAVLVLQVDGPVMQQRVRVHDGLGDG